MDYESLMEQYPRFFDNRDAPLKIVKDKRRIAKWQKEAKKRFKADSPSFDATEIGVVFEDDHILIIRDLVEFPTGRMGGYSRLFNKSEFSGAKGVAVFPILEEAVILINHYRHATRSWHWEIPRGFGEPGINPDDQAKAEIREEIGTEVQNLTRIGSVFINTGMEGNETLLYLAEVFSIGHLANDEGIYNYRAVTRSEMEQMIASNEINDGFTLSAFAIARAGGYLPEG